MEREIALQAGDVLSGIIAGGGIPALGESSFDEKGGDVLFTFSLPDYRGAGGENPRFRGYIHVSAHENGRLLSVVIPSILSTKDSSPSADLAAFADALQASSTVGAGKFFLSQGSLGIASDVLLSPSSGEADLRVGVHLGVRSALNSLFDLLLRSWSRKAEEALDEATWKQRVAANFELLERLVGPSPLGERLSGVI